MGMLLDSNFYSISPLPIAAASLGQFYKAQLKYSGKAFAVKPCLCKDQIKKEMMLKNEALREKAFIQQKLSSKSEELKKSNLECSRLEQRNMAPAKELAVLKLLPYLDLQQKEILKLASLGNDWVIGQS
ncbi:hypothetical protein REPUB_Repub03eG0175800 [Reevesia pubescens]